MSEKWMSDTLLSLDEKVRVELGPQLVSIEANDITLADEMTAPWYKEGKVDGLGKPIVKGQTMTVVDWRSRLKPKVWKIYQRGADQVIPMKDGSEQTRQVWDKVAEIEDKDAAIARAREIHKEMV